MRVAASVCTIISRKCTFYDKFACSLTNVLIVDSRYYRRKLHSASDEKPPGTRQWVLPCNPPSMDWDHPDVYKKWTYFQQKCYLLFEVPFLEAGEDEYALVRMLLLWIGDVGLEIYNNAKWDRPQDSCRLSSVMGMLDEYCLKLKKNIHQSRHELRQLQQGDMKVYDFLDTIRQLVHSARYTKAEAHTVIRDTFVSGVQSDAVRKACFNSSQELTLQRALELALLTEQMDEDRWSNWEWNPEGNSSDEQMPRKESVSHELRVPGRRKLMMSRIDMEADERDKK